jgi:arylsulfatase A-like enzyme
MLYKGAPDLGLTPGDVQYLIDLYDDEIAYFDSQLALLLQELERGGFLENSLVVFVADHGEEFLEHGQIKHCRTLFDSLVKVPLLLRIPGVEPAVLSGPAQALDLVPTVLDYLGLDTAKLHLEGRSLRPMIAGKEPAHPYQYSSQGSLRAVSDTRFKLVWDLATEQRALYDLKADPGETRDVLQEQRRAYGELKKALVERLAHLESTDEVVRQAREAEKQLRALGYLE